MAEAAAAGRLKRNFQGYSTDRAQTLLGFGASAIGTLPQGYVQNAPDVTAWREAVRKGDFPIVRGIELSADDRRRRDIINTLMCDLAVDLDGFGGAKEQAVLETMAHDGLVELRGNTIRVTERGRPLVRNVAAVFDTYLDPEGSRHSRAI
jgi:oxygen-independent coproporphyrinogen-3 oxidase